MAKFVSNRNGGSTDEEGLFQFLDKFFPGEVVTGLNVTQMDTPGLGVEVQIGTAMIPSGSNYPYVVFADASENVTLATADGSNPRIDLIVAYVDLSVVDDTNPNNPGAFLLENISGTPSGSPAVPNAAAIQAVIGASNPYIILARVAVAAGATTITNANVTDVRDIAQLGLANLGSGSDFAYQSFTPAYTNITAGNGTSTGKIAQIGKIVHISTELTLGSTSSVGSSPSMTLPVTGASLGTTLRHWLGFAYLDGNMGLVRWISTTAVDFTVINTAGTYGVQNGVTALIPITWGAGSVLSLDFWYVAA